MKSVLVPLFVAVAGLGGLAAEVAAQGYPEKPVKILVGYPPGGAPDFVARTVAQGLSEILGQQFVVENRPSAGGILATDLVAKAPADGYTLLSGETGQLQIVPYVFKSLPYDPIRDFTPIALVGTTPGIIVTTTKSNIKTVKDLISAAKADPGKLNYGSSGIGTIHHLTFAALSSAAGIQMTHVPFKGAPLTLPALLNGEIHVMMTSVGVAQGQMKAGTINILAVTSADRFPPLPDVPAVAEDLKGFNIASETGILGPAGLPQDVKIKLSKAIKTTLEKKEMQERYAKISLLTTWLSPEAYAENIKQSLKKFGELAKAANIQPN